MQISSCQLVNQKNNTTSGKTAKPRPLPVWCY